MRQFVADASHELRTPLTAVSAYAELFEQGAATRADDLQRVMHGIRSETARMGQSRRGPPPPGPFGRRTTLEREEVELVGVTAEAVQTASTVGPQWPVRLVAARPGRDRRRPHAHPPGARQPARQRPHPLPGGTRCVVTVDTRRPRRGDQRRGRGPGSEPRRGGSGLRTILPGRRVALAPFRRCRPRSLHRGVDHQGPRRHRHRRSRAPTVARCSRCASPCPGAPRTTSHGSTGQSGSGRIHSRLIADCARVPRFAW